MCGLAFSGKTTLAKAIAEFTGCQYISLDEINAERGLGHSGDGIPIAEWERTHHLAMKRMGAWMKSGQDILLDDTGNLRWLRDRYRTFAARQGYTTRLIYMDVPVTLIRERMQANRSTGQRHSIRAEIFAEHLRTFESPHPDEDTLIYHPDENVKEWIKNNFDV